MPIIVRDGATKAEVAFSDGATVLAALRDAGYEVSAPCGGNGTCGKCRMLIRDDDGLSYRLACQTPATSSVEVSLTKSRPMEVSTSGFSTPWVADKGSGFGIAIDVGTTTLVARLHDLATGEILGALGRSNPQLTFGADVISRITACVDGHLETMQDLLGEALGAMVDDLCEKAGISRTAIKKTMLVANTTMEHIAAGIDPTPIGSMPFTPPTLFGSEHDLTNVADNTFFAPCVAGYVGGDITSGLTAIDINHTINPVVFLDLGTNGEMALGDESGIITCATAAGPVFEGANVKFGMPAYPGAISQVSLENGELRLTVIGDEEPIGICGTGLIDCVALMLENEILDGSGLLLDSDEVPEEVAHFIDEVDGDNVFRLTDDVYLTQKDIRCLQLAKSAVCAGILTMLDERGIGLEQVSALLIAGGFGEYLNLANAARVGIFPTELLDCAKSVGNTAIEGASAALTSSAAMEELEGMAEHCKYLELSLNGKFNEFYVETMMFEE